MCFHWEMQPYWICGRFPSPRRRVTWNIVHLFTIPAQSHVCRVSRTYPYIPSCTYRAINYIAIAKQPPEQQQHAYTNRPRNHYLWSSWQSVRVENPLVTATESTVQYTISVLLLHTNDIITFCKDHSSRRNKTTTSEQVHHRKTCISCTRM